MDFIYIYLVGERMMNILNNKMDEKVKENNNNNN